MNFSLVVVRAFGPHAVGDTINDEETMRTTLAGAYAGHVMRITRMMQEA